MGAQRITRLHPGPLPWRWAWLAWRLCDYVHLAWLQIRVGTGALEGTHWDGVNVVSYDGCGQADLIPVLHSREQ
eukprot:355767-Chlamydomonas_euryale.AAC.8